MSKVAFISGGARGIGAAIAYELAKDGYDIVINYLTSAKAADKLKTQLIEEFKIRVLCVKCDISDEEAVDEMIALVEKELGSVDVLINNAAVDLSNLFHLKNAKEFRRTLDVNVVGAFNLAKRVYPNMLKKEYGRIINISSTNGINTYYPMCIDYDASKAALISLTHDLAAEFAPYINVNCIAPGFIITDMTAALPEKVRQEWEKQIPLRRGGTPEDVANVALFLASDLSSYVSGQVIHCCGAMNC